MNREVFELQGRIEETHWWFTARRRVLLRLASELLPEAGTVLDCGCGTGGNICAFRPDHRRIGVDPSPEAISIARAKCPGVEFICGTVPEDALEVLWAADLVLLTDVLEHVEGDSELLAKLVGGMKPGANLLITVPADPSLWSPHDVSHGHFRRYTAATLVSLWGGLPVEVLLLAPFNRRLYLMVWLARRVTRALGRGAGPAGTDLRLPARPVNQALFRVFAGEANRLSMALAGKSPPPGGRGVSLLAVLRRNVAPGEESRVDGGAPVDEDGGAQ
jgi:SAM-dependent methyltransferase